MVELSDERLRLYKVDQLDIAAAHDASITALDDLLSDPYAEYIEDKLLERYNISRLSTDIQGALQFYYFVHAAEIWAETNDDKHRIRCNELLKDPYLLQWMDRFYRLPHIPADGGAPYTERSLRLFKVGTTSFILAVRPREQPGLALPDKVLKLIKPRHTRNPTISRALEEMLTFYAFKDFHNFIPTYLNDSPNDPAGGPELPRRFLAMAYVSGKTLREELTEAAKKSRRARADSCLALTRRITRHVCSHLHSLKATLDLQHLDLSPENLILNEAQSTVCLLDFGFNHALRGAGAGAPSIVRRAARYVAPELKEQNLSIAPAETADAYSLGMILVELLAGTDPDLASHSPDDFVRALSEADPEELLDRVRAIDFWMGARLEMMLDANPESRLFEYRDDRDVYQQLSADLINSIERFQPLLDRAWMPKWKRLVDSADVEPVGDPAGAGVSSFLAAIKSLVLGTQVLKACRRLAWTTFVVLMALAIQSVYTHWNVDWNVVWPGWLVGFTFAFVATKYYLSIYATISAAGLSNATHLWMRLNAVSFGVPIGYAFLIDPTAYAACCAWGVSIVSINNHLALRLARAAETEIAVYNLRTPRPVAQTAFLKYFDGWELLTLAYVVMLVVVHVGMRSGVLQDVEFYALVIVVLNLKMFFYNCTSDAPVIRSGLMWLYQNLRRARGFHEANPRKPAKARTAVPEVAY